MENANYVNQKGKLLKEIRKEANLTQEGMAKQLGIHRERIAEIETGKKIPDWLVKAVKLQKFLKELGYSLEDLSIPDDNL